MKNMLIAFFERCFLNCNVNHSNTQLVETVEHLFNYKYEVVVTDDYNDDYFVLRLIEKENNGHNNPKPSILEVYKRYHFTVS